MGRFFFHVFNGHGHVGDEEGQELEDRQAVRDLAVDSVRSMVSEDARRGVIDLSGRIAVYDESGALVLELDFPQAFEMQLPSATGAALDD